MTLSHTFNEDFHCFFPTLVPCGLSIFIKHSEYSIPSRCVRFSLSELELFSGKLENASVENSIYNDVIKSLPFGLVIFFRIKFLDWNNSPDFESILILELHNFKNWLDFCLSLCFRVLKIKLMFNSQMHINWWPLNRLKSNCTFYCRRSSLSRCLWDKRPNHFQVIYKRIWFLPWTITSPAGFESLELSEHWMMKSVQELWLCFYAYIASGSRRCAKYRQTFDK